MATISLCMIVKDEEKFLEQCLLSVQGLVDEIVIVDTGSTDKTKEIALRFTSKVYDFVWGDDFAAARNESLKYATGEWILILDADEVIDEEGRRGIKEAVVNKEVIAYAFPQLHYTNNYVHHTHFVATPHSQFKGFFVVEVVRLFRNRPIIRFEYCVHETVSDTLKRNNLKIESLSVPIHHYQESKGIGDIERKQEFYFRLSLNNIRKYPNYAKSYSDVGIYYSQKGEYEKALEYCQKAVELEPAKLEYRLNLSYRLRDLEKYDEAIVVLRRAVSLREDEAVFRALGYIYYQQKKFNEALESYSKALDLGSPLTERVKSYINIIKLEISNNNNPKKS